MPVVYGRLQHDQVRNNRVVNVKWKAVQLLLVLRVHSG